MAAVVSLRSRIPEIVMALPTRVETALVEGATLIARDASQRAPVLSGALSGSIEARPLGNNQAGIYALWRWHFTEFGTVEHGGPQPFLMPAAEAGMAAMEALVAAMLRTL